MRIVVIESPFAGNVQRNLRYLRACIRDAIVNHGEAPYASHALYTQPGVLDDGDPDDRVLGMQSGFEFKSVAACTVVYTDLGISPGMQLGIDASIAQGFKYEYRVLGDGWENRAIELEQTFKTRWPENSAMVDALQHELAGLADDHSTLQGAYELAQDDSVDRASRLLQATILEQDGEYEGREAIALCGVVNGNPISMFITRTNATEELLTEARRSISLRMLRQISEDAGPG